MIRSMPQLAAICFAALSLIACFPALDSEDLSLPFAHNSAADSGLEHGLEPRLDPGVLTGQLQNGFRYYLRSANSSPRNDQLEVRLIVKAGSLHERPDQLGFAHLLEHMAYRGTASFSQQDIEILLSENGMRWGADVNATTHYGATVYRFSLTKKDVDLLPEIFTLMSEWLDSPDFDPLALENEKRIIAAELRERYADRNHIVDPVVLSAYAGSRYSSQHPAGDINTIRNASVEGLKEFWKSHYRADNAALVVTGSAQPWRLEPLIASHFAKLEGPSLAANGNPQLAESAQTIPGVTFFKDGTAVELQSHNNPTLELPQVSVNFISGMPDRTNGESTTIENSFRNQLLFNVYSHLLRDRIDNTQECSTVALEASRLESMQTVEHVKLTVTENNLLGCLAVAFNAADAVSNTKLTSEEFAEFRQLFQELKQLQGDQYRNRSAASIADNLVDMVANGENVLSSWDTQNILQRVVDDFDRKTLNRLMADVGDSHRIVYSVVTNKPVPLPLSGLIAAINNGTAAGSSRRTVSSIVHGDLREDQSVVVAAKTDTVEGSSLASSPAGDISIKASHGLFKEAFGEHYYEWQLGNGSTVLLLPDERFNHVAVTAISKGGYANRPEASAIAARSLPEFLSVNGVDGYTHRSLRKAMEDNQLSLKPFVGLLHHGIKASGRSEDMPTLLTMMNSYFGELMILEPQSSVFLQQLNERKSQMQWQQSLWHESKPELLSVSPKPQQHAFVEVHKYLFGNVANFDFVFVGSVEPDELQRQLERIFTNSENYRGKIHSNGESLSVKNVVANPVAINHGEKNTQISFLLMCQNVFSADDLGGDKLQQWRLLSDVVAERLRYKLREELGIVYEIESDIPVSDRLIHQVGFSVAPGDATGAADATYKILSEVSSVGITSSELAGALARDSRRLKITGSDYQAIADEMARQLLFSGTVEQVGSSLLNLDEINQLARCIDRSTPLVALNSSEVYRSDTLANKLIREESSLRQQQAPAR